MRNEPLVAVAIDDERCIGSGQCELLEEQTFLIDDDTVIAKVIGAGELPADRARRVVDACPARAISIVEPPNEEAPNEDE